MNYWINSAYDANTYKVKSDSLEKKVENLNKAVKNDSIVIEKAKITIDSKDETIKAGSELSKDLGEKLEKSENAKRILKQISISLGLAVAVETIIILLK